MDFDDPVDENYGVDPDSYITENEDNVVVPENRIRFSDADVAALRQSIDPLGVSENYGIDLYEQTLLHISSLNQQ